MADSRFNEFNLVGGTALSLMIGHRKSIDIDLFSPKEFDSRSLGHHISSSYNAEKVIVIKNGVFCRINGIKVDILTHDAPMIDKVETIAGIRLVSLKEIGAMKLNAIHGNGTRLKDFVDMHVLLEKYSFEELLDHTRKKYPTLSPSITKQSMIHHEDIDFEQKVDYIGHAVAWDTIVERLKEAFYNPHKIFKPAGTIEEEQQNQKEDQQKETTQKEKRSQAQRRRRRPKL
jgi:Nucleotidyl transferase AbiEii toxin, Type IV TA system